MEVGLMIYIKYRRASIKVDIERPKTCSCCGKTQKKIDYHHWIYAYPTDEVRKNPQLVLDNGNWLCFTCHNIANALKHVMNTHPVVIEKLKKLRAIAIGGC